MEGNFQEGAPGYYEVKNVAEIEGFDPDQYGNIWYNVIFQGDAETFMWLKKDPPVEGQKYYGHLEKTRSGKRLRFKTDKVPEGAPQQNNSSSKGSSEYEPGTNTRWAIALVYRAYVNVMGTPESGSGEFPYSAVKDGAVQLVKMFHEVKQYATDLSTTTNGSGSPIESKTSAPQPKGYDKFQQTKQQTFGDGAPLPNEEYSDPFPN